MNAFAWISRLSLLALLWWTLTAGDPASWLVGIPVVVFAAFLSHSLRSTHSVRISVTAAVRYIGFFLIESIKGGVDVAGRAVLPGQRVAPCFLTYRTTLPAGWPRALFANTVSLLPGTLTVEISGDRLRLHALAMDMRPLEGVRACEQAVAAVFGVRPTHGAATHG